jgi:hypothetical protein
MLDCRPPSRRRKTIIVPLSIAIAIAAPGVCFAAEGDQRPDTPPQPTQAAPPLIAPPPATGVTAGEPAPVDLAPPPPPPAERPRRPWFGGIGYASIAPFFGEVSALESGLRAPDALGESYGFGDGALLLGGGGGAVLFGHLWLGGHGFGLVTAPFHNARGEAALTGGGGAFELGYVLSTGPRMLVIPFFAAGGFSYHLDVKNKTTGPMPLLAAFSLSPGASKSFNAGFATIEAGVRLQRLLFTRSGGFCAGLEAGVLRSLNNGPWLSGNSEFTHEEGAQIDGVYVRVNIGGGGFFFR